MFLRNARSRRSHCALIEALEGRQLLSTTYYVSPSGNNNFAGTITKPWRDLNKVNLTKFNAGDQILLQGGATFSGSIYLDPTDMGTSAAPIKISSYGTGRATISPGTTSAIYCYNNAGISVSNLNLVGAGASTSTGAGIFFYADLPNNVKLSYVKVDQVDSRGFQYGMEFGSWNLNTGYDSVSVTNSSFHDNARAGLFSFAQNMNVHTNVYVGHVTAYNNLGVAPALVPSGTVTGHGILLSAVNGAKVERSIAHDNGSVGDGGAGIWTYDSNKVTFQYNESYHNRTAGTHDGDGFDLDRNVSNSVVQYNYSHDNDGGGYLVSNKADNFLDTGNVVRYNISQNDGRKNNYGGIHLWGRVLNAEIYNNTVYMNTASTGTHALIRIHNLSLLTTQDTQHVHFRNNILYANGAPSFVSITSDALSGSVDLKFQGNDYYSSTSTPKIIWGASTYTSISSWRTATGQEKLNGVSTGFTSNPLFTSAGGGGTIGNADLLGNLTAYKLQSTSPMINKAFNMSTTFAVNPGTQDFWGTALPQGTGYDLGADEF